MSALPAEPAETPEPAWRRRAVERSTRAAKLRAEQRVQRFLDAAQELITVKGTTDFTVQEVVERSRQSLRSFYQHFDGKHELLLALFEDALAVSAVRIRERAAAHEDPLMQLRAAVVLLYEDSVPRESGQSPLFSDFAVSLLVSHPVQVATAHLPLLDLITELVEAAVADGSAAADKPRRAASLLMQTAMFTARAPSHPAGGTPSRITADEVWAFCAGGIGANPATGSPAAVAPTPKKATAKKTVATAAKPASTKPAVVKKTATKAATKKTTAKAATKKTTAGGTTSARRRTSD
jgi:AcrR family transcriptional regulator